MGSQDLCNLSIRDSGGSTGELLHVGAGGEMEGGRQKKGEGEGSGCHALYLDSQPGLLIPRI